MKGSVLVKGGGISGIVAALDLAESGFFVYLLDEAPSIGGLMVRLDKTFPTGDCAMCTIAPRLVEIGRHPNIKLLTYCKVEDIEGSLGAFKVRIKKKASFVDYDKCTGCALCAQECPVSCPDEFNESLSKRNAIYRLYPQAIPNVFTIQKEGIPPCKDACPAGVNACGYIQLIKKGKFDEAVKTIREKNPFLSLCAYVCHHPCERACLRAEIDEPIAIRRLKRFLSDWYRKNARSLSIEVEENGKRVAIIGGGPAGIACAYFLRKDGFKVKIFEKEAAIGGTPLHLIPSYRLPKEILEKELSEILSLGIEVECKKEIKKEEVLGLSKEFDAVVIATGAPFARSLRIEGEEGEGVYLSLPFLRMIKEGRVPLLGKEVIVIGGGNVAMDCARSARRVGAEVKVFCLEEKHQMPAHPWEVEEAEEEGIKINCGFGPQKILLNEGKVIGVEFAKVERVFDEKGRFSPTFKDEKRIEFCNSVIIAIGQMQDTSLIDEIPKSMHFKENIFLAGDIINGPSSVVEAVASAQKVASLIKKYINGAPLIIEEEKRPVVKKLRIQDEKRERMKDRKLPVEERSSFSIIELGVEEEEARREAERCLSCAVCCECFECERVCEAKALRHNMEEEEFELEVGAIICAEGFSICEDINSSYGYGRIKDVLKSIEFERLLSASGPTGGKLKRPSDGKEPKKIAFIQCVGSRDTGEGGFCSAVCCAYAIKQALIAKEHAEHPLDIAIFYMDLRMYGKGFEAYYKKAKEEGVRFINARPAAIEERNGRVILQYLDEEGVKKEEFCMVVLSVGIRPKRAKEALLPLIEREGMLSTSTYPKDIPDAVIDGSAAAALASSFLAPARGTAVKKKEYPPPRSTKGEKAKVAVFVCNCGRNIGGYIDVPYLVDEVKKIPDVVYAEHNLYTCSQDTQKRIIEKINEYRVNRVVVASCTPRTHEVLFQETLKEAGLNPYLFEMANIRDQCSWVHQHQKEEATKKALSLIKAAIVKATLLEEIEEEEIDVNKEALVIGGGIAGMQAALNLSEAGFSVHLIEKEDTLGGMAKRIKSTLEGEVDKYISALSEKLSISPNVNIYTCCEIEEISGYVGNFNARIKSRGDTHNIKAGVIIVATGAQEYKPSQYLYGESKKVFTQTEFEERAHELIKGSHTICMIQCVGGRSTLSYCGRVCCAQAIKNALWIKEHPDTQVFILYRDIRTYEFLEKYYTKARDEGIIFIKYKEDTPPVVEEKNGELFIKVKDDILKTSFLIKADLLLLSVPPVPAPSNEALSKMLKVPLTEDGFFLEAHLKLRPVEFQQEGIYLCGTAHSPRRMKESILQSLAASAKAKTILSKEKLRVKGGRARLIDSSFCRACKECERVCQMGAISFISMDTREVCSINPVLCKGCGACASVCQSGAIRPEGFETFTLKRQIQVLL